MRTMTSEKAFSIIIFIHHLFVSFVTSQYPTFDKYFQYALQTQRDLQSDILIPRLLMPAVQFQPTLFNDMISINASFTSLQQALSIGIGRVWFDLFWVGPLQTFWLCSPSKNETSLKNDYYCSATLNDLMEILYTFLQTTMQSGYGVQSYQWIFNLYNASSLSGNVWIQEWHSSLVSTNLLSSYTQANNEIPFIPSGALTKSLQEVFQTLTGLALQRNQLLYSSSSSNLIQGNAWPTLREMVSVWGARMIFGLGKLDRNLSYNATGDSDFFFLPQEIRGVLETWTTSTFLNTDNCNSPKNGVNLDPSNTNSSTSGEGWGFVYISEDTKAPFSNETILKVVNCGYSPLFNGTVPTEQLMLGTIWSWDPTYFQPVSAPSFDCCVLKRNSYWNIAYCPSPEYGVSFYAACEYNGNNESITTRWKISSAPVTEGDPTNFNVECPDNYAFSVPKSPIDNAALLKEQEGSNLDYVLLNYNDDSENGCWVIGNEKCMYQMESLALRVITAASYVTGFLGVILTLIGIFGCYRQAKIFGKSKKVREYELKNAIVEVETYPA